MPHRDTGEQNEATRRRVLRVTGTAIALGVAGCLGDSGGSDTQTGQKTTDNGGTSVETTTSGGATTTRTTSSAEETIASNGGETTTKTAANGGGTPSGPKPDAISLWNTYGAANDAKRTSAEWLYDVTQDYQSDTDVKVKVQGVPKRLTEKVLSAYKAHNAPDLAFDYHFNRYVTPGKVDQSPLMDISKYVTEFKGQTYDVIWPKVTFGDRILGVPQTVNARNWFYNKSLVKEAGYDPEKFAPTTKAELEKAIKDITEKTDAKGWIWPGGATAYNWYFPAHFMRTWFGTELTDPVVKLSDGTKDTYSKLRGDYSDTNIHAGTVVDVTVRADSDEMKTIVGWMKKMYDKEYVPKSALSTKNNPILTATFPNQQVGLYFSGPWAYSLFDQHVSDFEWDVFGPILKADAAKDTDTGYFISSAGKPLMMLDQTKHSDYAGKFIQQWFSKGAQQSFVKQVGSLSVRPEINTKENFSIPQLAGLADIVENATFYSPPEPPADVDLRNTVGGVVQRIVGGNQDLDNGLKNLQNTLDSRFEKKLGKN